MVDQADMTRARPPAPFRDDEGAIRAEFLDRVREAIESRNAVALQALVGEFFAVKAGHIQEIHAVLFNLPDDEPTNWPADYGPERGSAE